MEQRLPAVHLGMTVDVIIFSVQEERLNVLLVRRRFGPFQGRWAIPGGFVGLEESLEDAAIRELREETGVRHVYLEQLYTFGDPNRDPRGRVVTVAYFALISSDQPVIAGSDATDAQWFSMKGLPRLAFDHDKILDYALVRLRNKLEYTTVGFQLLPPKFTLTELQKVYEAILDKKLDKRNFRRKIALLGVLRPLEEFRRQPLARPAQLFEFSQSKFEKLKDRGILFPF